MKRFVLKITVAAVVAATVSLTPLALPPASAAGCFNYEFIGARGSGEPGDYAAGDGSSVGMGPMLYQTWISLNKLAVTAGKTVRSYGVHYDAIAVDNGHGFAEAIHLGVAFDRSVQMGADDAKLEMSRTHKVCSDTKFILGGYSQGAQAMGKLIASLSADEKSRVAATILYGDPMFNDSDTLSNFSNYDPNHSGFNAPRTPWPALISTPVVSYCHDGDIFCGLTTPGFTIGSTQYFIRDFAHIKSVQDKNKNDTLFTEHENYDNDGNPVEAAAKLAKILGFAAPASPKTAPSDTVFVIDSTGSMGDEISAVEANVVQLAKTIASKSGNYRFALVDYKDGAEQGDAYQAQVDVPFTDNTDVFAAGVNAITADGGGDWPESMYSGIMAGLNLPWRDGVKKSVIVIADAPGKNPEPGTGYTLQTLIDKAFAVDPAQIYSVPVRADAEAVAFMQAVSDGSGGTVTSAATSEEFIASLESAIIQAGSAPAALVVGDDTVETGADTKFSAAGTISDPADPIVAYDWNFGTGTPAGKYDVSSVEPVVSTKFVTPGTYTVAVRAHAQSGLVGLATAAVVVADPPSDKPGAPTSLTATGGDGSVSLQWKASAEADFYVVEDGDGKVIDTFAPQFPDLATVAWSDALLDPGVTKTYSVRAGNSKGLSAAVGPVKAVTTGASTPTPTAMPTPVVTPEPTGTAAPAATPETSRLKLAAFTVQAGGTVSFTGDGFTAGQNAAVWLHSTPTKLQAFTAQSDGSLAGTVTIPALTEPGAHQIEVRTSDGSVFADLTVTAKSGTTALASAGVSLDLWWPYTALLLGAGGILITVSRRRHRTAD
ncbi:hypothetical protein JF66_17530 [Cryobacterium sp. MLB-32]|uniref:cutinase family protein n=1 Tax=Cryobacterium sp. MLB-32 TaxID=1529318 RepID=UPI0004E670FC|nr:cutinase family protein [Cryobacterium sp. MLB-32]KFF58581.1 hypothetical protein JF66_17530 [Cryobacterium sp. MLB-32]